MSIWPRRLARGLAFAVSVLAMTGPAGAQTKLKWAHVTNEPYHTEALWAAGEIQVSDFAFPTSLAAGV